MNKSLNNNKLYISISFSPINLQKQQYKQRLLKLIEQKSPIFPKLFK